MAEKAKGWKAATAVLVLAAVVGAGCSGSGASSKMDRLSASDSGNFQAMKGSTESALANTATVKTMSASAGSVGAVPQAAPPAGFAPSSADLAASRLLIYRANLTMEVKKDYEQVLTDIRNHIHVNGGYILGFSDSATQRETGGTFTIKIPSTGFHSFLNGLEGIHPLLQRTIQGQDVTEEYVDLESRLKSKQALEARLVAFMEKATTANDLVHFSNELGRVQEEIERLKGRMRYLEQNAAFSTVELRVYQRTASGLRAGPDASVWAQAGQAMSDSMQGVTKALQQLVVFAAGALPILILLGAVAWPVVWSIRKTRKKRSLPPTSTSD